MKITSKKLIIPIILVIILLGSYLIFLRGNTDSIAVKKMDVEIGTIEKELKISGTVESTDYEEIFPASNLKVIKVNFKENERVKKGDLLAQLEKEELEISLAKAELNLKKLRNDFEIFNDASNPEKSLAFNTLKKSKNNYEKAKKDLTKGEEDLNRSEILLSEGAISQSEYDAELSRLNDLKAFLETARINYDDAKLNLSNLNEDQDSSKNNLQLQIKSLELDIENIKSSITDRDIYSSIDGLITNLNLIENRKTNQDSKIFIYNDDSYKFISKVTQEDALLIDKDLTAIISLDGLEKNYEGFVRNVGKIAEIDEKSGSQTPKVEITLEINNPDEKLASGYNGNAIITLEKVSNVLKVRNESIKNDEKGNYLYLISSNKAKKTYVDTGISDGYFTSILSGIAEKDIIVLNPPIDLKDGDSVSVSN